MPIPAIALISGLTQLAPLVAKMIGKGEEGAEVAATIARKITGTDTNDAALEAFKSNPTLLVDYQKALLEQEAKFEEMYVSDKNSARSRDIEFLRAGTRNYRSDFLVGISVIVVFTILAVVILKSDLNEYAKGSLTTILGLFLNQLSNIYSFEFGTTRKTDEKNEAITKAYIKS